jgi:hypothetical protein
MEQAIGLFKLRHRGLGLCNIYDAFSLLCLEMVDIRSYNAWEHGA